MHIFCNSGVKTTDMVGDMPGVGEVWYHSEGIASIPSTDIIHKDYQVTYDSRFDNTFRVWNEGKTKYRSFRKFKKGLYYIDMSNRGTVLTLATVKENKSNYSELDSTRARAARKLQETMRNISTKYILYMINKRLIQNCPITANDILVQASRP